MCLGGSSSVCTQTEEASFFVGKRTLKKKNRIVTRALKILHEKSRIFEMRRISFLQKNTPKKKNFPPQQAVVARFARASLTATERRGGSILRDNKKRKFNLFSCTVRSTNHTKPIRLTPMRLKMAKFLQLWGQVAFFGCKNSRASKDIANSIFLRSKKII